MQIFVVCPVFCFVTCFERGPGLQKVAGTTLNPHLRPTVTHRFSDTESHNGANTSIREARTREEAQGYSE
jgi:hypothetical protein